MAKFIFPSISPSLSSWSLLSNTGSFSSPLTGAVQTADRTGERWQARLTFRNENAVNRRLLQALHGKLNGMQNRVMARDDSYFGPSGTVNVTDLHPALLAANYSSVSWQSNIDISGGVRIKRNGNVSNGVAFAPISNSATVAGLSYALRTAVVAYPELQSSGRVLYVTSNGGSGGDLFNSGNPDHITGMYVGAFTAVNTSVRAGVTDNIPISGSGYSQFDLLRSELARCFLVDNGFNSLTRSQEFDHADWSKVRATVTANAAAAPDGTTTADELVEDSTASSTHFVIQTSTRTAAVQYWTASVNIEENTSQRIRLTVDDGAGNGGNAYFDANTGTIMLGPTNVGTGTNTYATIHSLGSGRYRCRVSCRLPATTNVRMFANLTDGASNTITFNGDGSSGLYLWGAQLQLGGQLGRYTSTTTAAILGTNQTGNQLWIKGLDSNVDGQLLAGDQVEINGQLLVLQDDLGGDESGVGLLNVAPRIRTAPADEDAVVLYRPHGTFLLSGPRNSWSNKPGIFSDFVFDLIEDIAS